MTRNLSNAETCSKIMYKGWAGTIGAEYVPYLIADKISVPPEIAATDFSEKVIYTDFSYFLNDYENLHDRLLVCIVVTHCCSRQCAHTVSCCADLCSAAVAGRWSAARSGRNTVAPTVRSACLAARRFFHVYFLQFQSTFQAWYFYLLFS
eukprot:SAG31_NODE_190_length_20810_cov_20.296364_16_plen_150_part_00